MSESIELRHRKKSVDRALKKEDLEDLQCKLQHAQKQAIPLGDKDLLQILSWFDILAPLGATANSVINLLATRTRKVDKEDETI